MALIVRCTSAWEMHLRGSEAGWASAPLGSVGCAALFLRPGPDRRDAGGVSGSSGSGAEHPPPQSAGASTEERPSPQVSAASLRTLRSLCVRASFGFVFLSQIVVPKIANLRNHRKAGSKANT